MLQLDQNAAVSTEAQNVLVWAILTNSSRKNAAWSLLQRTQANPHARAQTFYCAAVDDARTWQAALRLFWQEGEYMFFLRGLVHRFNQASELAERMQYSDNLQEMCDKNVFAEMDRQQLQRRCASSTRPLHRATWQPNPGPWCRQSAMCRSV